MLIDQTYFIAEINIAGTTRPEVIDTLNALVGKYEPMFLRDVLGIELSALFVAGLTSDPIDQRYVDIRDGKVFQIGSMTYRWRGLIEDTNFISVSGATSPTGIEFVVGGTGPNDPAPGSVSYVNTSLDGSDYIVNQRGVGIRSWADEIQLLPGGGFTLLNGETFVDQDRWFLNGAKTLSEAAITKRSIIADFIYYWYVRDVTTFQTPVGETSALTQNSVVANPDIKMSRAWNEMVEGVMELVFFLRSNYQVYPEFANAFIPNQYFRKINIFGI